MPLKPCPRCKQMIPYGMSYCSECLPTVERERAEAAERKAAYRAKKYNQAYNRRRAQDDPKYRTFRNSKEWKVTSRAKLQACGYKCEARLEGCGQYACEVHHIEPLKTPEGWGRRLDWDNLMGVCIQCHNLLDGKTFKRKKDEGVVDLRDIDR